MELSLLLIYFLLSLFIFVLLYFKEGFAELCETEFDES